MLGKHEIFAIEILPGMAERGNFYKKGDLNCQQDLYIKQKPEFFIYLFYLNKLKLVYNA